MDPIGAQQIQDGGDRHLEKKTKIAISPYGLTDLYEIWYADAKWVATAVKKFKFHKSKMADGGHSETATSSYLCNLLIDFD